VSTALSQAIAELPELPQRLGVIRAAVTGRLAFATSLGMEDQALLHAIADAGIEADVFTLDTGRHFPETYDTLDASLNRYRLPIRVIAPEASDIEALVARDGINGFRQSVDNRKACCNARKVRPLARALAGAGGWMTGLRRGQSSGRSHVPFAEHDPATGLMKFNPLADWSLERLEAYIAANDIPISALHAQGFPSIGCQPCTRAIRPGEDVRAGRWWWESEDGKECGLHNRPRPKSSPAPLRPESAA
jgi:phosphoadenosine phosphosulfate reductase